MPSIFAPGTYVRITDGAGDDFPETGSYGVVLSDMPAPYAADNSACVDFYGSGFSEGHTFGGRLLHPTGRVVPDRYLAVTTNTHTDYTDNLSESYGRDFIPGCRVRVSRDFDSVRVGQVGTYLGRRTSNAMQATIEFDEPFVGHDANRVFNLSRRRAGYNVPFSRLDIIAPSPETFNPDAPLAVGDSVKMISYLGEDTDVAIDACGRVVKIEENRVGVCFFGFARGHDLAGQLVRNERHSGYWVSPRQLRRMHPHEPVTGMDGLLQLGTRVRWADGGGRNGIIVSMKIRTPDGAILFGVRFPGWGGGHDLEGALNNGSIDGWFLEAYEFTVIDLPSGDNAGQLPSDRLANGTVVRRNAVRTPGFNLGPPTGSIGIVDSRVSHDTYIVRFDGPEIVGLTTCGAYYDDPRGYILRREHFTVFQMPAAAPQPARPPRPEAFTLNTAFGSRRRQPPGYGDVVTVRTAGHLASLGLRPGLRGTVITSRDRNGSTVNVDFATSSGVTGSSYGEFRNVVTLLLSQLEGYEGATADPPEGAPKDPLVKGDAVETTHCDGRSPPEGTEGVVISVHGDTYDVDFHPYRWKGGHDVPSNGHRRSGYLLPRWYLKKLTVEDAKPLRPFYLVGIKDGKTFPITDDPGYDDGRSASEAAKVLTAKLGYKVQARKNAAPDDKWREREMERFKTGEYKAMPSGWTLKPIEDHFIHLSNKQPGFIAFTPSVEYGQQDRQVFTRPGAYLKKYYPELSDADVMRYGAIAACDGNLEILTDTKSIVEAYRTGPDSCMKYNFEAGEKSGIRLPAHPAAVYGESDLALAILKDEHGRMVSRCLVWPERKMLTRGYGDIAKIYAILEALGYSRGNFQGAKIRRIPFKDGGQDAFVVPYIDDAESVQGNPKALGVMDDGKNLIIDERGCSTNVTQGWLRIPREFRVIDPALLVRCQHAGCGRNVEPNDVARVMVSWSPVSRTATHQNWCSRCVMGHTYLCQGFNERVTSRSQMGKDIANGHTVSEFYIRAHGGVRDAITGGYFFDGQSVRLNDGSVVHESTARRYCYTCNGSKQMYRNRGERMDTTFITVDKKKYNLEWAKKNAPEIVEKYNQEKAKTDAEALELLKKLQEGGEVNVKKSGPKLKPSDLVWNNTITTATGYVRQRPND